MALLDRLRQQPGARLVVAHFDHGIRPDSAKDRELVRGVAAKHGLPFVFDEGQLGPGASEAQARTARYGFLRQVQRASNARAIVTAHHQDDVLETAILNLLRGTDRKGLSALQNRSDIRRPLLDVPKIDIINYAREQNLQWREDSTNQDETYLRNYIRHRILPRFNDEQRQQLWQLVSGLQETNRQLDGLLVNQLHMQPIAQQLDRAWFIQLPHMVAREVMATWLRARGLRGFDRKALERLVVGAKTSAPGKQIDALKGIRLLVGSDYLALAGAER